MFVYYAVPVRQEKRKLSYNPKDGHCALGTTPGDAYIQLGLPGGGSMFAVWILTPGTDLETAGEIASVAPPVTIFAVFADGVLFPLGVNPALDVTREVPRADSH